MDIEEPVKIENEMNITKAVEILNKLKSKVTLVEADEKEYRLPFLMNIEQQAIETVLSELENKIQLVNLMALAILNYDDQLVINKYKDINDVKETFEEILKEEGEEYE